MRFKAWHEDSCFEDGKSIKAFDHEVAAERYAEWYDATTSDYPYANGHREIVYVQEDAPGTKPLAIRVSAEHVLNHFGKA